MRVREALTIAIDRDRISADEMGGATEPAKRFLPETAPNTQAPVVSKSEVLEKNTSALRNCWQRPDSPVAETFRRCGC